MILNVCGFGWSGSGAVLDLLREYDEITFPSSGTWEFNFLWAPDGLYDLEQKLCVKHCRIFDSYLAIERFLEIAKKYGDKKGPFKYDKYLEKPFYIQCKDYINKLVQFHLETNCFVHKLHPTFKDHLILEYNRFLGHFLYNKYTRRFYPLENLYRHLKLVGYKKIHVSYNPDNFLEITQNFVESIINQVRKDKDKTLLLDQSVPPDVPHLFDHFFKEKHKTIIIRRDPRDHFIIINELKGINRPVPNKVEDFICFYKKTIAETKLPDSDNIMSLNYEDLIYDYESTIEKLENFICIKDHINKKRYFDPNISINNTQLINLYPKYKNDILKIEKELSNYLYPFDRTIERNNLKIF